MKSSLNKYIIRGEISASERGTMDNKIRRIKRQIEVINNSNLTEEEKSNAIKAYRKMMVVTTFVVVFLTVIVAIAIVIGMFISIEIGAIIGVLSIILMSAILIVYAVSIRKSKSFSPWVTAYEKASNGFDGLDEQEINRLKPNEQEESIIKKYKLKKFVNGLAFLIVFVVAMSIIHMLGGSATSPITIIIALVIAGAWYFFDDTYSVEIHRLQSGYYKKSYGFICQKCGQEVTIYFEDLETCKSLPKNEDGIRVKNCPMCDNPVPFYNFDNALEDYKKYLEHIRKV